MRAVLIPVGLMLLAGCAGEPKTASAPEAAAPAAAPVAAAAPAAAASSTTKYVEAVPGQVDPKTLEEAMKAGYRVVNEKGQTMYCREDRQLGSHLKKQRTCLTPEELTAAREANQRSFDNIKKTTLPPQGK